MLKRLQISAYKSIENQEFELKPLTLLTGTNSSGKSSVIQAMLLALSVSQQQNKPYLDKLILPFLEYEDVHCRWSERAAASACLSLDSGFYCRVDISLDGYRGECDFSDKYEYEKDFFYLASNRSGQEEISRIDKNLKAGEQGQYLLGTFEYLKNKPIAESLVHPTANTPNLKAQLAYWLSKILAQDIELESEKVTSDNVKNTFKLADIGSLSPINVGAGNSYLAKLLILGLISKPGYLLLIENPEIHLHPKAQSKLAEFFTYLAEKGVQLVLETHSEHFLNGVRYQVYDQKIDANDVKIYYKPSIKEEFLSLNISPSGHYLNANSEICNFPAGFFDATLEELIEIG